MDTSSEEEKLYHKQLELVNKFSLMFLRMTIANDIKTIIPQTENAKEYLKLMEDMFHSEAKSLTGTLMALLMTIRYDGSKNMQEHIIEMSDIAARLKTLRMTVDDFLLV
ncbi:hypothetical protein P3X46_002581 [Hevea brasiliensis]|uniref:UBN2_2 domain-containing protein n=1 Tax=Hevea brasiliensis TaxID=3981 RepID=A0ABQ9N5W0_HEVBR|nr:hypothetical protein P3X46_002581 [Hevea brasiliensis]